MCVCIGVGVCVCVCDSGATRFHFLIPLTETPFKRLAIGKMPASTVHSTKYLSVLDFSVQAFSNSGPRSKLASREQSAEF